jgi:hypothetical protein
LHLDGGWCVWQAQKYQACFGGAHKKIKKKIFSPLFLHYFQQINNSVKLNQPNALEDIIVPSN